MYLQTVSDQNGNKVSGNWELVITHVLVYQTLPSNSSDSCTIRSSEQNKCHPRIVVAISIHSTRTRAQVTANDVTELMPGLFVEIHGLSKDYSQTVATVE